MTPALRQCREPRSRFRGLPDPAAAVDGSDRLWLAWAGCRFRRACAGSDIVMTTSTDGLNF